VLLPSIGAAGVVVVFVGLGAAAGLMHVSDLPLREAVAQLGQ
jgi:hypothetical protein